MAAVVGNEVTTQYANMSHWISNFCLNDIYLVSITRHHSVSVGITLHHRQSTSMRPPINPEHPALSLMHTHTGIPWQLYNKPTHGSSLVRTTHHLSPQLSTSSLITNTRKHSQTGNVTPLLSRFLQPHPSVTSESETKF